MARKLHPSESRPDDGRDDLAVLHPEREVTVGGRTLTVREYGFVESMQLRHLTAPIVDGLYVAFQMRDQLDGDQVLDVLAEQPGALVTLVARAADVDEEWVRALPAVEGEQLTLVWWIVNRDFFVSRATRRIALARAAAATDGATSTPPSSPTGTAAPSGSAAIPSGN